MMNKKIIIVITWLCIVSTLFLYYKTQPPYDDGFLHDITARFHKLPDRAYDENIVFDCQELQNVEKDDIRVLVFSYPIMIANEYIRRISFQEINYTDNKLEQPSMSVLAKKTCKIRDSSITLDDSYREEDKLQDLTIFYLEGESEEAFLSSIRKAWVYVGSSYSPKEEMLMQRKIPFSDFHP